VAKKYDGNARRLKSNLHDEGKIETAECRLADAENATNQIFTLFI
jgi:hypothetical protein